MCGIAGLWRFAGCAGDELESLERMSAVLRHRGPDDFGYLAACGERARCFHGALPRPDFSPELGLVSRRLVITDPTPAGCQPLANESDDVFVVFNGAIHNYLELRDELEARGHHVRSRTDTEVVVHAYEEWGEACAERFNGMWAYAIWDRRRRRLVCSRDRFGIKPFYVAWHGDTFYFASEAKAILAAGGIPAAADPGHLRRFLGFRQRSWALSLEGRRTPFVGIEHLEPAHNLVVSADGSERTCYWRYDGRRRSSSREGAEQAFRDLFLDALRIRLRSDVPIALLLSGGLDSSSIALGLRQVSADPLEMFTAIFPGFRGDEHARARRIGERTGFPLHTVEYDTARLFDDLSAVTWHLDAPPGTSQTLPRWQLLEVAAGSAPVVLEGQGADELLAGYPSRYLVPYLRSELAGLRPRNLTRTMPRIVTASTRLDRSLRPFWRVAARHVAARVMPSRSVLSRDLLAAPLTDEVDPRWRGARFNSALDAALVSDHARDTLPHLIHFGDAISMGHSVESRLPFLDHRLVELVLDLPFDLKIRGGVTKYLLRNAFAEELPPETAGDRNKIGFATPLGSWLAPRMDDAVRSILLSRRARERGVFDARGLERLLARAGEPGAMWMVFRCLAVERWFELFVDGDGFGGQTVC